MRNVIALLAKKQRHVSCAITLIRTISDPLGFNLMWEGLMAKRENPERRDFLKKAAYSAPAILTLQATSGVAKAGSEKPTTSPTGDQAPQAAEAEEEIRNRLAP